MLLITELAEATRDAAYVCAVAALMPYGSYGRTEAVRLAANIAAHARRVAGDIDNAVDELLPDLATSAHQIDDLTDELALSLTTWKQTVEAFDEVHQCFDRKQPVANLSDSDIDMFRVALYRLSVATKALEAMAAAVDAIKESSAIDDSDVTVKSEQWSAWRKQCIAEADALFNSVYPKAPK